MKAKEYFDRCARILDQRAWKPATAPWAAWAWDVAAAEIGPAAGKLIVDLGSGTGAGVENLMRTTHGASFLGVDFSEEMTRCASEKRLGRAENIAVEFRVQRIDRLDLPPDTVGHFVSSGTFHHVRNKRAVLARLFDMLEPGGSFVNIDHFRSGDRTRAEMEKLRRMHPDEAAENDRVRQSFQWIYDQDRDHPIEFHTDPYEFCDLLRDVGFRKARVYVSLQPNFAVVTARKPARAKRAGARQEARRAVAAEPFQAR